MLRRFFMPSSKWSLQYIEKLKELFPRAPQETIQQAIPSHSWVMIKRKAGMLGIDRDLSYVHTHLRKKGSYNEWSLKDEEDLKRIYATATIEELKARFPRDYSEIKRKAGVFNLKRDKELVKLRRLKNEDEWSEEEDRLLVQLFISSEFTEDFFERFKMKFPLRTDTAIYSHIKVKKMFSLRSTPLKSKSSDYWTNDKIEFLKNNYNTLSWKELEKTLERSRKAIQDKASSFGLIRPKELFWREGMWSKEELDKLSEMWPLSQIEEIFDAFPDRQYQAMTKKMYEAGIKRLIKNSTSEILMKRLLDETLPGEKYLDNERYDWLRSTITNSKMELDRYYPDLKLAFEYDGEQHYNVDAFYRIASTRGQNISLEQAQKEFDHYVKNDQIKKDICSKLGIKLIILRYDEELNEELIKLKIGDIIL